MNKDVMWLVFVLILIAIVFNLQRKGGGIFKQQAPPESPPVTITPPVTPASTGTPPIVPPAGENPKVENRKIRISAANAYAPAPANEYIVLENIDYENKREVNISGFLLQNRDKISAKIGGDENGASIILNYGERAIVVTGESPLGHNFKINKCSGYFNQRSNFSPPIYVLCPTLSSIDLPRNLNNRCVEYIESLQACVMPTINADTGINNECAGFVNQHASYAACVADYKNDKDFDKKEWRVYLGKNAEMWSNRHDLIQLFDSAGKLITEISY